MHGELYSKFISYLHRVASKHPIRYDILPVIFKDGTHMITVIVYNGKQTLILDIDVDSYDGDEVVISYMDLCNKIACSYTFFSTVLDNPREILQVRKGRILVPQVLSDYCYRICRHS